MKKIVILEGPDGGGKTVLAKKILEAMTKDGETIAFFDHGPYKGEAQIWKRYFDSMLPAYSNEVHVLLDRCWLAEPIYGRVYRGGLNRMQFWQTRILEHVAGSCATTLIYCLPGLESCVNTFNSRREQEMLANDRQLTDVYYGYLDQAGKRCTFGKSIVYNYRVNDITGVFDAIKR
jgi:hypothetical protein